MSTLGSDAPTWTNPDLSTYIYPHTLVVAIPENTSSALFLGQWTPAKGGLARLQLQTDLKLSQLKMLQRHEDFGMYKFPNIEKNANLAAFLSDKIAEWKLTSTLRDMVTKLISHIPSSKALIGDAESTSQKQEVHIFSITVLSASPTNLVTTSETINQRLVWKWAKPSSPYRKSGIWEPELVKAVDHAEWNAGKGFEILVKGVE